MQRRLAASLFGELREFFKMAVGKTNPREHFLRDKLVRPPIIWEDVKVQAWPTVEEQETNEFPFSRATTRKRSEGTSLIWEGPTMTGFIRITAPCRLDRHLPGSPAPHMLAAAAWSRESDCSSSDSAALGQRMFPPAR